MPPRVLLAIDDRTLRNECERGLTSIGYAVSAPGTPEAAHLLGGSFRPDIVVIDHVFGDAVGTAESLRRTSERYVIQIEPTGHERRRIELLSTSADDVVAPSVGAGEIVARCYSLMRRPLKAAEVEEPPTETVITIGPLTVDTSRHEIRFDGRDIVATRIEFQLLEHLVRHPSEVVSRHRLLDAIWGPTWVGANHVVDVHMSNLRRKIAAVAGDLQVVATVRGIGFRIGNELLRAA